LSESSAGPLRTRALLPREPWRRNQVAVTVAAALVFFGLPMVTPLSLSRRTGAAMVRERRA